MEFDTLDRLGGEPQVHFSASTYSWKWITLKALDEELEALNHRVKEASGYRWDNPHWFFDDSRGKPAIQFIICHNQKDGYVMSLWNAVTGTSIKESIKDPVWTPEHSKLIRGLSEKIADDLVQCLECGEWVPKYIHYSFAGAVCEKCYDPKKHLPPDTSG